MSDNVPLAVLAGAVPMSGFADAVLLTRDEVFGALEACAAAEAALLAGARRAEAAWVSALFELLEDRVTTGLPSGASQVPDASTRCSPSAVGSNSSDRELTQ